MFCSKCGAEIRQGNRFCHRCGALVEAPLPGIRPDVVDSVNRNRKNNNSKNDNTKVILIVVSIVFVILLVCTGIIFFKNDSSDWNVNVENPTNEEISGATISAEDLEDEMLEEEPYFGTGSDDGLTPGSYTFSCSVGKMGGDKSYPVKVEITIDSNNNIKGRYSYDSTIRKYGDVPSSYFYITGQYDENETTAYMDIKLYGKDEIFEKWKLFLVAGDGSDSVSGSGEFTNMNTYDVYEVKMLNN